MKSFTIKTSLTKRLQRTMVTIAVFSIAIFFVIYLSSLNQLNGLTSINTSNAVFSYTNQALQAIENSEANLFKIEKAGNLQDIRFSFNSSQKIIKDSIYKALQIGSDIRPTNQFLISSQQSMLNYDEGVNSLINSLESSKRRKSPEEVRADILAYQQFIIDAKEGLLKAQISLKKRNDDIFNSIYKRRFYPLIVATVLSIFFFGFVVTIGFSISRKFRNSIFNLIRATEVVGEGNLAYNADILENDEIGRLTDAFNKMVVSLRDEKNQRTKTLERISRLQEITAKFSEALTVNQVGEVTVKMGFDVFGANSGAIALLNENDELEINRSVGQSGPAFPEKTVLSLDDKNPLSETLRFSNPIFIEGKDALARLYPELNPEILKSSTNNSWAFVPLEVASAKIGSLGFYFVEAKTFSEGEKNFIIAMGRQCAQAIHRSNLYDEARIAIQARDEFLSIASHELKTPLTSLKLQFQMIGRHMKKGHVISPEQLIETITISDRQIQRLTRLIDDLLDVGRITTGKLTLNYAKYNLSQIINEIIQQYQFQLKDASNKVEVIGNTNIDCECDLIRIEQVLINLLTNATKYAPGKPIRVELVKLNGHARIRVTDQGPGIAAKDQARIFERFERVRGSQNVGGLGLGLFISKQIVRAHQGDIWVESEPGKGSTFVLEIPLYRQHMTLDGNDQMSLT